MVMIDHFSLMFNVSAKWTSNYYRSTIDQIVETRGVNRSLAATKNNPHEIELITMI